MLSAWLSSEQAVPRISHSKGQWHRSWEVGLSSLICCWDTSPPHFFFIISVSSLKLHFYFITADLRSPSTLKKGKLAAVYYTLIFFSARWDHCKSPCGNPMHHPTVKLGCVFPFSFKTHMVHPHEPKNNHHRQSLVRRTSLHKHRSVRNQKKKSFPHPAD